MLLKCAAIIGAVMASVPYVTYQQNMCINSGLFVENKVFIEDKVINKDYDYLKENLRIPQLKEKDTDNVKIINQKILDDIMPTVSEDEMVSKEYNEQLKNVTPYAYEINYDYSIDLENSRLISIHSELYEFLGGAHGLTTRYSYTIDKEKMSIVQLKDLFKENYTYKKIIDNEIRKQIKEQLEKEPGMFFNDGNDFKGVSEESPYYLDEENLIIYFQQYEIAPYAAGIIEFKIPLSLFGSNFIYQIN